MELICRSDTIEIDFIEQKLKYLYSGNELTFKEHRNAYQKRELMHFFDIINGKEKNTNDIFLSYQRVESQQKTFPHNTHEVVSRQNLICMMQASIQHPLVVLP